jgi:hypothetical protein
MSTLPTEGECPTCRTRVLLGRSGRCVWCDTQVATPPAGRPKARANANRGVPVLISDELLERAHAMHMDGMSLRGIAAQLHPETAYSSPKSLVEGLRTQFRHRGWYVRPQREATIKASTVHGKAPRGRVDPAHRHSLRVARGEIRGVQCAGIKMQPPRKGQRCSKPALQGSDYCRYHDPARRDEVVANVLRIRALRGQAA